MPKKTPSTKPAKQAAANAAMAKKLAEVLSDTYVLAVKTHGYHWNVKGIGFAGLHAFFEKQYDDLIEAADEIAERIRALGLMPDGSMEAFLQNTLIKEAGPKAISAMAMLKDLVASHQILHGRLAEVERLADETCDVVTQDLMVSRMAVHEKTLWMIRSHTS